MQRTTPPFRADHVGSLLRPPALKEARAKRERNEITAEALRAVEDREIEKAIKKQEEIGLKLATDGEFRRSWWHFDFFRGLDGYFLEYDTDRSGGFEPLRYFPKGNKQVVLGLVTSKFGTLEKKDDIKRRIDEATKYVALDQLCLSPQCGFASTEEGNVLSEDEQWAKLAMIVELADEVWG